MVRGTAALGAIMLLSALARAQPSPPQPASATAFVDVDVVVTNRPRIVRGQTVVVRDGRIAALGPAARVKLDPGVTRIDGRGKFLMPGIAEMHGHLPGENVPEELAKHTLALFVASGVTTVRGMQGAPNQLALRARIARGELLGPRLFVYSPPFQRRNTPTPEAGVQKVREFKAAGYDGIKILEGMTAPVYEAVARAARGAKLPFGGHVPNDVGLERALAAGQQSIDHLDGFVEALAGDPPLPEGAGPLPLPAETLAKVDAGKLAGTLARLVAATKKAKAMVVPTMAVWRTLFGDASVDELARLPELKYTPESSQWLQRKRQDEAGALPIDERRKLMALRDRVLAALARAGGVIMLGADAPQLFSVPGFSLRNETAAMVKAGMTPAEVVEAATIAPARYLGVAKEAGNVAVGQRADLILVDGNPLDDVANIFRSSGVMLAGRWLPRAELDAILAEIEAFARKHRFPVGAELKDVPISASQAAAIIGSYAHPNGTTTLVVEAAGAGLEISARDGSGTKSHRLQAQGDGSFLVPAIFARVTFELRDGRAVALLFAQGGAELRAPRVPR